MRLEPHLFPATDVRTRALAQAVSRRVRGVITLPFRAFGVALAGTWEGPHFPPQGTVIFATADAGKAEGPPLISLSSNATLKGVTVFYPDQRLKVGRNSEIVGGNIIKGNLQIGDLLYTVNIGAYSIASATKFNGFDGARILHLNKIWAQYLLIHNIGDIPIGDRPSGALIDGTDLSPLG